MVDEDSRVAIGIMINVHEGISMQFGIFKLIRILESEPDTCFTAAEYMNLYTTTYNMCTQKPPHEYSEQLYERYKRVFKDYLTGTVCSPSETGL